LRCVWQPSPVVVLVPASVSIVSFRERGVHLSWFVKSDLVAKISGIICSPL
jgi:hypothetical protein